MGMSFQVRTSTTLHSSASRAVVTCSHGLSDQYGRYVSLQPEEYNNKTSKKIFTGTLISFALRCVVRSSFHFPLPSQWVCVCASSCTRNLRRVLFVVFDRAGRREPTTNVVNLCIDARSSQLVRLIV
jgi:hypothetical protein